MRKLSILLSFCIIFSFQILNIQIVSARPGVSAQGAVLIEQQSGRILFGHRHRERLGPASTTKIMTAIVAFEYGDITDIVTISEHAAAVEGSSMWLEAGEKISLEHLIWGLMLASGNDAATAIAEHISGSEEKFAELMNETAQRIGVTDTNFTNPHGLSDDNHYTTALDLALITAYGLNIPKFAEIVATQRKIVSWEGREYGRTLNNHNRMLYLYEGSTGVKTGFTRATGRCLVSSAIRTFDDGTEMQLIAVTLNAPNDWADHTAMLNYGFYNFSPHILTVDGKIFATVAVANGEEEFLPLTVQGTHIFPLRAGELENVQITANLPEFIEAPINEGDVAGNILVTLDGVESSNYPLLAMRTIERQKTIFGGDVPPTEQSFGERFFENLLAVFSEWIRIVADI